jgi:hypothetical protein
MSDAETTPGRGGIASSGQVERRAAKLSEALQKALSADEGTLADLEEVAAALIFLQAQASEWATLNRLIHDVLVALAPFHSLLVSFERSDLSAAERQALLQRWRPCQRCVDELADLAEDIACVGHPLRREGRKLEGERWAVDVVALQMLIEDALKEENLSPGSLLELAEELDSACHRHLAMVSRRLKTAVDEMGRLLARFPGRFS